MDSQPRQRLPIADAAAALGLSEKTVRRRIKAGTLAAEQVRTAQGFLWLVDVGLVTAGQVDQDRREMQITPPADLTRTVVDEVTRSLSRRIEELVRENEQLRTRLAALEAPRPTNETVSLAAEEPAPDPAPRSWWQRLLFG